MTTWIRLDPRELALAGVQLRDVGMTLDASATRVRNTCCAPGLGRHAPGLMAEGQSLAQRIVALAEDYLRQAVDVLQRAVAAINEGALVSSVSTVGAGLGSPLVGGFLLGQVTPVSAPLSTGWNNPGFLLGTTTSSPVASSWWGTGSGRGFVLGETGPAGGGGYFHGDKHLTTGGSSGLLGRPQGASGLSGGNNLANQQLAAANTRALTSMSNVFSGLGNPLLGYSQSGLQNYENKFGSSFQGKSVRERFG